MPVISGKMNAREREICDRVKEFREGINWSQQAFAEQLGLTRDQLAHIEYRRTPLRYDIAWRIRRSFGLSVAWLWCRHTYPYEHKFSVYLPTPESARAPKHALLSEVLDKAIRPNEGDIKAAEKSLTEPSEEDVWTRFMSYTAVKMQALEWFARLPDQRKATELFNEITKAARPFVNQHSDKTSASWVKMLEALTWAELGSAAKIRKGRQRTSPTLGKDILDSVCGAVNIAVMSAKDVPTWTQLKKTIAQLTSGHGQKAALASELGVSKQVLGNWLSDGGQGAPNAELTLRLFKWSLDPKRQSAK